MKSSSGRITSGKHTPAHEEPQGEFGEFVRAAELRERLEQEKIKEAETELKMAKQRKKKGGSKASAVNGAAKGKNKSTAAALAAMEVEDTAPPVQRLEEHKQFPGGLEIVGGDDSGLGEEQAEHDGSLPRRSLSAGQLRGLHRQSSDRSRSSHTAVEQLQRPSYLNICGPAVSDEEVAETEAAGVESNCLPPEGWTDSSAHASPSQERKQLVRSNSATSASSRSTLASIHDQLDSLPDQQQQTQWHQPPNKSASTRSLKSWRSSDSPGAGSLASGGANAKLSKPLLELEELELKSFLKHFNRHTREVRVPASVHFPRKRMPRWEDFRIPPDEAAIAAREGKRVTVLTHVDRGLQALARQEGEGVPLPRSVQTRQRSSKTSPKKTLGSQGSKGELAAAASSSSTRDTQHVKWTPESGFVPQGLSLSMPGEDEDPHVFGSSFGTKRRMTEKNEREVKQMEKHHISSDVPPDQQVSLGGKAPVEKPHGHEADVNVHDEAEMPVESNLIPMADDVWEVIGRSGELEGRVDPHEGERVDGVAFCIAYILALVERYAPEELDNTTDQTYREGRARSHLERLYLIAPFWERLGFGIRKLYRWDNPGRTATAAMIYFVLWWTDLLPTAFFLTLMYYILQFRFFPPEASYLHEQVRARMSRGVEADRLAERLRRRSRLDVLEVYRRFTAKYGMAVQLAAGDVADFHEKVKNLILWRNPQATWRTFSLFAFQTLLVTFIPAYWIWKMFFFFVGFTFFCLLPLQSHYPRYRRPLSPIWWALWGAPTDAQFAIQLLRRRQVEKAQTGVISGRGGKSRSSGLRDKVRRSEAAHAVKGGAMRPMNEGDDALWGLEEDVGEGDDGQRQYKPKKLGSFFCQHHGVPGHLSVTTRSIYFRGLGQHKTCKTPLEDIAGLAKTRSLLSSGLQVARTNKPSLFFSSEYQVNCFRLGDQLESSCDDSC